MTVRLTDSDYRRLGFDPAATPDPTPAQLDAVWLWMGAGDTADLTREEVEAAHAEAVRLLAAESARLNPPPTPAELAAADDVSDPRR